MIFVVSRGKLSNTLEIRPRPLLSTKVSSYACDA
jgi:hypothetical protein